MDIFQKKLVNQDLFLKEIIDTYLDCGKNTDHFISQTTLTYLILKTNTVFTDQEYQLMMNLSGTPESQRLYDAILDEIRHHSKQIFAFYKFPSLLYLPLTNTKDISYQIGLHYTEIFFAPTTVNILDNNLAFSATGGLANTVGVIKFIGRFNEMWIITSLLNREYLQLV